MTCFVAYLHDLLMNDVIQSFTRDENNVICYEFNCYNKIFRNKFLFVVSTNDIVKNECQKVSKLSFTEMQEYIKDFQEKEKFFPHTLLLPFINACNDKIPIGFIR